MFCGDSKLNNKWYISLVFVFFILSFRSCVGYVYNVNSIHKLTSKFSIALFHGIEH